MGSQQTSPATVHNLHPRQPTGNSVVGGGDSRPPALALRRHRDRTSGTGGQIRFDDGTTARTDLVRLAPDIEAYSLGSPGRHPDGMATYRFQRWESLGSRPAAARQEEISWILEHGYPRVDLVGLTAAVVAAGHDIGPGVLKAHEAIAATQAALWHLTSGLRLDVQELDRPIAQRFARSGQALHRGHRNSTAVVGLYRHLLAGARALLSPPRLLSAPTLARVAVSGSRVGPLRWAGSTPAHLRVLGSVPAFLVNEKGERCERLHRGQDYHLEVGLTRAAGELVLQASHEVQHAAAVLSCGPATGLAVTAPLVTIADFPRTQSVAHRLILRRASPAASCPAAL